MSCRKSFAMDWDYITMMMNSEKMGYRVDWLKKVGGPSAVIVAVVG